MYTALWVLTTLQYHSRSLTYFPTVHLWGSPFVFLSQWAHIIVEADLKIQFNLAFVYIINFSVHWRSPIIVSIIAVRGNIRYCHNSPYYYNCFLIIFGCFHHCRLSPCCLHYTKIDIHDVITRPRGVTSDHPTRFLSFPLDDFAGSTGGAAAASRTNLALGSTRPLSSDWLLGASPR